MKKILWKATRGAKFIPQSLWKKDKAIWPNAPYAEYMLCRKLYLTNIETLQVEIREFDAKKRKQLSKQFTKLFKRFEKDFNKIEQDFRNSFEEFKTEAFWNKYLELEKR